MAVTQLSDVIIPEVYDDYGFQPEPYLFTFLNSPAVRTDAELNAACNRGGLTTTIPYWNDLDASADPNISNDDPTQLATPDKIGADEMQIRVSDYNNAWSAADLVGPLAGSDPMGQIKQLTNRWWSKQMQRFLASIAQGIADANVANDNADMVNNISTAGAFTGDNLFSHNAVLDTMNTMDEFDDQLRYFIMPNTVYTNMRKQNAIQFTAPSDQKLQIPVYGDIPVLRVSDKLLGRSQGAGKPNVFTTIMCGPGAFAWGEGNARVPSEVRREPAQGNGGGVEQLWERIRWSFAVSGHTWTNASVALQSPTSAEWGAAANWKRKFYRNNIPLAFLRTNG